MKKVLYVIIGLFVVYLILCVVGPKESGIERTIVVNQKPEVVKAQLVDFKFMNEKWSPWSEKDSNMKITYSGEVGKPGYKYDWDGNPDSVGAGTMEFAGISGDSIKQKLIFKGWGASNVYLIASPEGEGTKVTWKMVMPMGFIWRGMGMFMDSEKMMGRDFNNGIAKMKTALESLAPATANYEVKELEWPEVTYIGSKRETVEFAQIPVFFGKHAGLLMGEFEKNKIKLESPPSALYFAADIPNMKFDMAVAFRASNGTKIKGYEVYSYPASKVLQVVYMGDYNKLMNAYNVLEAYIKEKGIDKVVAIEEYVNDPMTEKDTAKWQTNIYYILKK